jgi:hypothetical protein
MKPRSITAGDDEQDHEVSGPRLQGRMHKHLMRRRVPEHGRPPEFDKEV